MLCQSMISLELLPTHRTGEIPLIGVTRQVLQHLRPRTKPFPAVLTVVVVFALVAKYMLTEVVSIRRCLVADVALKNLQQKNTEVSGKNKVR